MRTKLRQVSSSLPCLFLAWCIFAFDMCIFSYKSTNPNQLNHLHLPHSPHSPRSVLVREVRGTHKRNRRTCD
ncbi:hypothetical protein F4820DRAFT_85209 [Hypoxylon rubiginosum]|uniref:Uncharacterized protein n=1 Tax=Hypoxylon rubiginosum TaxID=110542 RepID=A0ACB9YP94_9PEZI|nr:hypothetical protein F4820DRAFT_85209 [Hypoxylon rubiginosum]